jgi:hypothetical protein
MSFTQPGLHVLFGAYNSGKSTLIAQAIQNRLHETLVFDLELSGWSSLAERNSTLKVLRYAPPVNKLTELFVMNDKTKAAKMNVHTFDWIMQSLDEHAQGKKVIVFDTGIALEKGLKDKITENPAMFGVKSEDNSYGKIESNIFRPAYKNIFQHLFVNLGIEQIFMVFQIRTPWDTTVEAGKVAKLGPGNDLDLQGRIGIYRQEAASIVWLVPSKDNLSYGIVIKERSGENKRIVPAKILEFDYEKLNNEFWNDPSNEIYRADLSSEDVEMIGKFGERDRVQEAMFAKFMPDLPQRIIYPVENHNKEILFAELSIKENVKQMKSEGVDMIEIAEKLGISLKEVKAML